MLLLTIPWHTRLSQPYSIKISKMLHLALKYAKSASTWTDFLKILKIIRLLLARMNNNMYLCSHWDIASTALRLILMMDWITLRYVALMLGLQLPPTSLWSAESRRVQAKEASGWIGIVSLKTRNGKTTWYRNRSKSNDYQARRGNGVNTSMRGETETPNLPIKAGVWGGANIPQINLFYYSNKLVNAGITQIISRDGAGGSLLGS